MELNIPAQSDPSGRDQGVLKMIHVLSGLDEMNREVDNLSNLKIDCKARPFVVTAHHFRYAIQSRCNSTTPCFTLE